MTDDDQRYPERVPPRNSAAEAQDWIGRARDLDGHRLLDRILDHPQSGELIRALPLADFHWVVHRIGPDEALPLLAEAEDRQWQHLLDLELWRKDRLYLPEIDVWLDRFGQADFDRLCAWFLGPGRETALHYLWQKAELAIIDPQDEIELPEDFFTLDNVIHFRTRDPDDRNRLKDLLVALADVDYEGYQRFVLDWSALLPAENEEELYRLRNNRLAEHGFLSFEEAAPIYAPLPPQDAVVGRPPDQPSGFDAPPDLAPITPIYSAQPEGLLAEVLARLGNQDLADRFCMEFASLVNQVLAADAAPVHDRDMVAAACRKAAGHLNLALEKLCDRDVNQALGVIAQNHLTTLFRIGYGQVVKLKREAEKWTRQSWFQAQGLGTGFWGDTRGGALAGLLARRPQFWAGPEETEEYRDFKTVDDLAQTMRALLGLMTLDALLNHAVGRIDHEIIEDEALTFQTLLLTPWVRHQLGLPPQTAPLTIDQARRALETLRQNESGPPYRMSGYKEEFINDWIQRLPENRADAEAVAREQLDRAWDDFVDEYMWVDAENVDRTYHPFLLVAESPTK